MRLLILLFIFIFLLLLVVVFPLGMIVHCVRRSDKSEGFRALWIIAMVLTWPFGACLYGLLSSKRWKIKFLSFGMAVLYFAVVMGIFNLFNFLRGQIIQSIPNMKVRAEENLSSYYRTDVITALDTLQEELEKTFVFSKLSRNDSRLFMMMRSYLHDQQFTDEEAEEWLRYFKMRESLDFEKLEEIKESTKGNINEAFIEAVQNGRTQEVRLLLIRGADVNSKSGLGYTALMEAAQYGHKKIAQILLEHGANIYARTANGETALSLAEKNYRTSIVEMLKEAEK